MSFQQTSPRSHESGFSLIELSIVLAISGLLMAGFLEVYSTTQQKQRYDITKQRLKDIRTALTFYTITHGNLPCPASPSGDYSADKCAHGDAIPGVEKYKDDVLTGILPMKELRFNSDQIQDGWGHQFTYAVSRRLTLPNGMKGNPLPLGVISIVDEKGSNALDKQGTGRYVIISHGPSGNGAWLPGGGRKACAENTLDGKNCLGRNVFVEAPVSKQPGANFYDDIVIHDDLNAGGSLVDLMAICNSKQGFYEPLNPGAVIKA